MSNPFEAPGATERRYSAQDGLSLFWRDYGDPYSKATPLLCLPGLTRNGKDFGALVKRLSPTRRILCPDYRGRGKSAYAADWQTYQPQTVLNDIIHLLTVSGVHRCVAIGTSYGGLIGMGLAVAAPSALAGLVLNDIGPEIESGAYDHLRAVIGTDMPLDGWDQAAPTLQTMFPRLTFQNPASWEAAARNTWKEGDDGKLHIDWDPALAKLLTGPPDTDALWTLYRAVRRIPTLALRGEKSDMLSAAAFDKMQAAKPDLVRVTVPGAGHVPTLDEPQSRSALDDFLKTF